MSAIISHQLSNIALIYLYLFACGGTKLFVLMYTYYLRALDIVNNEIRRQREDPSYVELTSITKNS